MEKLLKIWKAKVEEGSTDKAPGEIMEVSKRGIKVATGENFLILQEIQLEGKKRMEVSAFLNGYEINAHHLVSINILGGVFMLYGFYFDPTYILIIIGMVICMAASAHVNSTFKKYSRYRSNSGLTGAQAAAREYWNLREYMMYR